MSPASLVHEQTRKHIPGVDGLRAVAVVAIILFHLDPNWLPGGFIGVDIFYVISGFVVALSVRSLPSNTLSQYFGAFYRRRILRIFPAVVLFVLTMMLFCALFVPIAPQTRYYELIGLSSLFALSNFLIFAIQGDYFGSGAALQPFMHTWSLAVEEQYYILFPFFSYLMLTGARWNVKSGKIATGIVGVAVLFSLAACAYFSFKWPSFAFYMLPMRFWELGIGLFLAIGLRHLTNGSYPELKSGLIRHAGMIGLVSTVMLVVSLLYADERLFPFPWAVPVCLSSAGLIVAVGLDSRNPFHRFLSLPAVVWIGALSYSLYLWHWGVIVALRWTVGIDTLVMKLLAALLMTAFAAASYYLVEKPIRYHTFFRQISLFRFGVGFAVVSLVLFAAGGAIIWNKPAISLSQTRDADVWLADALPDLPGACNVQLTEIKLGNGSRLDYTPQDCAIVRSRRIFVLGDSHAWAYKRMLYRVAAEGGYQVRVYDHGGCKFLPFDEESMQTECTNFRRVAAREVVADARPHDVLFLPARLTKLYRRYWDGPIVPITADELKPQADDRQEVAAAVYQLAPLLAKGMSIILEAPKPVTPSAEFRCSDWFNRNSSYCMEGRKVPRSEMYRRRVKPLAFVRAVADSSAHMHVWDTFPILCPSEVCTPRLNGKPIFIDTGHLSGYANDLLLPDFLRQIELDDYE